MLLKPQWRIWRISFNFFVLPLVFTLFSSFHCFLLCLNAERSDILSEISEGNKNITVVGVSQCWIVYYTQLHYMNIDIGEQKKELVKKIFVIFSSFGKIHKRYIKGFRYTGQEFSFWGLLRTSIFNLNLNLLFEV